MQIDTQGTENLIVNMILGKKNTFPFLFTLKLAKHGQSKGVTLRKIGERAQNRPCGHWNTPAQKWP
jgi:hypothetical protein